MVSGSGLMAVSGPAGQTDLMAILQVGVRTTWNSMDKLDSGMMVNSLLSKTFFFCLYDTLFTNRIIDITMPSVRFTKETKVW